MTLTRRSGRRAKRLRSARPATWRTRPWCECSRRWEERTHHAPRVSVPRSSDVVRRDALFREMKRHAGHDHVRSEEQCALDQQRASGCGAGAATNAPGRTRGGSPSRSRPVFSRRPARCTPAAAPSGNGTATGARPAALVRPRPPNPSRTCSVRAGFDVHIHRPHIVGQRLGVAHASTTARCSPPIGINTVLCSRACGA